MKIPISITISAETVAWYAAIVATSSLIIGILRYLGERINVVVECKANYRICGKGNIHPYKPDKDYIVITVINKGKRPITIQTVAGIPRTKKDRSVILTDSLLGGSRELKEGKSTNYLLEQDSVDVSRIKYFVAYDATGKAHKGRLKSR